MANRCRQQPNPLSIGARRPPPPLESGTGNQTRSQSNPSSPFKLTNFLLVCAVTLLVKHLQHFLSRLYSAEFDADPIMHDLKHKFGDRAYEMVLIVLFMFFVGGFCVGMGVTLIVRAIFRHDP